MYDLLLQNGRVLDPGEGLNAVLDVAVSGGLIAAVAPGIPADQAVQVLDISGPGRYLVPGLIDVHAHVARGATTRGVGMQCCDPDDVGVSSGVTTVVDAGSVGIANVGALAEHVLPAARTRVICYLNAGTFAHSTANPADLTCLADIDADGIQSCIDANPGLVRGIKLRLVGLLMPGSGEEVIRAAKAVARRSAVPLMVHIGDPTAGADAAERLSELTGHLIGELGEGDILTHLCTPRPGGVHSGLDQALRRAQERGVILDSALGKGNFGYQVAAGQFGRGLRPDTISTDLTLPSQGFHSLMECMAKFMAIGYSLPDVVQMTTSNAARAVGLAGVAGAVRPGLEADLTVMDVTEGSFRFTDTLDQTFTGRYGIAPVQTVRAGQLVPPRWGTHPWGWLPQSAAESPGEER
jgi:dihydroorotase